MTREDIPGKISSKNKKKPKDFMLCKNIFMGPIKLKEKHFQIIHRFSLIIFLKLFLHFQKNICYMFNSTYSNVTMKPEYNLYIKDRGEKRARRTENHK